MVWRRRVIFTRFLARRADAVGPGRECLKGRGRRAQAQAPPAFDWRDRRVAQRRRRCGRAAFQSGERVALGHVAVLARSPRSANGIHFGFLSDDALHCRARAAVERRPARVGRKVGAPVAAGASGLSSDGRRGHGCDRWPGAGGMMRPIVWPGVTVAPSATSTSVSTPSAGAETSTATLSVSISTRTSSFFATAWPGCLVQRARVPFGDGLAHHRAS